jgi:DNA processing protein
MRAAGARLVAVHESEYPERLLDLFDPPAGLFVRGGTLQSHERRVAIVGARNSGSAAREVTHALARAVVQVGVCVVSGAARGIDAAAHEGALAADGRTVAVLGCGIDVVYPRQNASLLARVGESGTIVSEYPPGTPAEPFRFPARNRIVAALAEAVVVVEGTRASGSLITADHAVEVGREVLAVPGAVQSELAEAPLMLIREGARMIRGPGDLLEDLGFERADPGDPGRPEGLPPHVDLPERERAVWKALTGAISPDGVAASTGLMLPDAMEALVGLELRGLVVQAGGRYRRRFDPSALPRAGSR